MFRPIQPALILVLILGVSPFVLAPSCSEEDEPDPPTDPDTWQVLRSPEAPEAIGWTADDLLETLGQMGLEVELVETLDEPGCRDGQRAIVLVGDGLGEATFETSEPTEQSWRIDEQRCDEGRLITLAGGGLLGRQYAAYEWLHALGVRFFHPEQEFVPDSPDWPEEPLAREHTPAFRYRSVSLHLTHPLELGDAFRLDQQEYFDEARRYIDWQVKNGASYGTSGIGSGELADYGLRRGFPRSAGFSLYGIQQGSRPTIDPDDPRPWQEQITEAIEARMGADPEDVPELFSFSFNPTEFTEASDIEVVEQLTFIADYFAEHYPETELMATNHGTGGEPTPNYGVRYYDLPQFAPHNLGVKVHTLMFYDLFRPAPVYGNEDFGFLYDFMEAEYQNRQLWYFPEAAWWLTFDNAVPLYLPITIEARDRDIQGISFMLDGGLDGHRVFGTGHEWGYWQNEYCSFRMAADLDYSWRDCVADITSPMGPAADEVASVLEDFIVQQERDIIYADILAYLVGTDPETEAAASLGIVFHPLPPTPAEVSGWDLSQVEAWQNEVLPALQLMEQDCADQLARLAAVEPLVDEGGRPFFEEIRDGIEVTGLRARHGWQVYGALVLLRRSQLAFDAELRQEAESWLEQARATTEDALEVIHRREQGYRYQPLSRSIAGGPDGTEDDNWTIYGYRYLNRTHHGYYYTRIDDLVADAFAGASEPIVVDDALIGPGESLVVRVIDTSLTDVTVRWGDGAEENGETGLFEHSYDTPGLYEVSVEALSGGAPITFEASVAALEQEFGTGFSGSIVDPSGATIIEGVLPALVFGPASGTDVAIGFGTDEAGTVSPELWSAATAAADSAAVFESEPTLLLVPAVTHSSGEVLTSFIVADGVVTLTEAAGPAAVTGQLSTEAVIEAVVAVGGFDEAGARDLVATLLGYTADTLPEQVAFRAEYDLSERP